MYLRIKMLLLLSFLFIFIGSVSVFYFEKKLFTEYDQLEKTEIKEKTLSLMHIVNGQFEILDSVLREYSNWDEMYNYVKSPNSAFIDRELTTSIIESSNLSIIMGVDQKNKVLFKKSTNKESDLILSYLQNKNNFKQLTSLKKKTCGLVSINKSPFMICLHPVKKSNGLGEYIGTLIAGKWMSQEIFEKINNQTNLGLIFLDASNYSTNNEVMDETLTINNKKKLYFDYENIIGAVLQKNSAKVSINLNDLEKKPIGKFEVSITREHYQKMRDVLYDIKNGAFILIVIGALIFSFLLDNLIVYRIKKIDKFFNQIKKDKNYSLRLPVTNSKDELGTLSKHVNEMVSIIEQQVDELEKLAIIDTLTQIYNRRYFENYTANIIEKNKRKPQSVVFAMIDVDCFKKYNDFYGHLAGDEVLKEVADIIKANIRRNSDRAMRVGGEEFVIILDETDIEKSKHIFEKILNCFNDKKIPHEKSDCAKHITASIGLTQLKPNDSLEVVFARADEALYLAKHNGRNRIEMV